MKQVVCQGESLAHGPAIEITEQDVDFEPPAPPGVRGGLGVSKSRLVAAPEQCYACEFATLVRE